jgi:hypothetical protein
MWLAKGMKQMQIYEDKAQDRDAAHRLTRGFRVQAPRPISFESQGSPTKPSTLESSETRATDSRTTWAARIRATITAEHQVAGRKRRGVAYAAAAESEEDAERREDDGEEDLQEPAAVGVPHGGWPRS